MSEVQPLVVALPGGRTATLTPTKGFPDRVRLKVEGGGAVPFHESNWLITSVKARQMIAAHARLSMTDVDTLAAQHAIWADQIDVEKTTSAQEAEKEAAAPPYGLTLRTIYQSASEANSYFTVTDPETVVKLLKQTGLKDDSLIEWSKDQIERLAILDLDFHRSDKPKPAEHDIDELGYALSPAPWLWWRTQGGGLHALYAKNQHSEFTAMELAAGAMAQLLVHPLVVSCSGTVEIVPRTRHPGATQKGAQCGPIHETIPDETFACLARFSAAGATPEEVEEVLTQNAMTIGQRVDHSFCIIDPTHTSTSPTPVIVMESGLYCHSCAGRLGDGFRSWASIRRKFGFESSATNGMEPIMDAVRAYVHFKHVDYLLTTLAPEIPEPCRQPLYSALLKQQYPDSPRHKEAFEDFYFVRGIGTWLHADTLLPVGKPLTPSDVSVLPSAMHIDDEGIKHPIQRLVSAHINNGIVPGWAPIRACLFTPIFAIHNVPKTNPGEVLCTPRSPRNSRPKVTYLPPDKRISQELAEQRISEYFPGISIIYVKALIIAMGCAESGDGMVPMLWATGQTEAAKTTTLRVVLQMFGDDYENLSSVPEDRLDQLFGEALNSTRLILFDDFAKEQEDYKRLHTFFIRINREGHTFHEMYKGKSTPMVNSAVILTDWRTPEFFVNDPQFGRRVHLIRLSKVPVSWEAIGHMVERWWTKTDELRDAACSFYSHLVDDFFPADDCEGFRTKMDRLGIRRVVDEVSHDIVEQKESLRSLIVDLAHAVCSAKEPDVVTSKRLGAGYREVHWGSGNAIGQACSALVDSLGDVPSDQEHLHHVLEPFNLELQSMLGLICSATFQLKAHGKRLFIRMVEDGIANRSPIKRVNRELFPVTGEAPIGETPTMRSVIPTIETKGTTPLPDGGDLSPDAIARSFRSDLSVPQAMNGTDFTAYLDFETQSACDLKKYGSYAYAQHPTTSVICAAICVNGYRIFWTMEKYELVMPPGVIYQHGIEFLHDMVTSGTVTIVAHNVNFEHAIWTYCLKLPQPAVWLDTADLTLMHGLPAGAEQAGLYLFNMGKDIEGYKLMMKTCKPDRKGVLPPITQAVVQRYINYNFRDTDISVGIADRFGIDIQPAWEREVNYLHHEINARGIGFDRAFAETLRSFDEGFKAQAVELVERVTAQESPGDVLTRADMTRNKHLLAWFARRGLELSDMRQDTLEQVLDGASEVDLPVEIQCVIENRLVVTRAALAKVDTAMRWANADGRIRAQFRYYGAHTGRWSGYGVQVQNLRKPDEDFDLKSAIEAVEAKDLTRFMALCHDKKTGVALPPYQLLGSLVRGIFVPAPGHLFLPADYSQVEARGLLWLAEDFNGLQEHVDFDAGRAPDVYCTLASTIYNKAVNKKENPMERQAGKIGQLACGYGGSVGAISRFAYAYGIDFAAAGVDPKEIVNGWRRKYPRVVQMWQLVEAAFKRAILNRGKTYEAARCRFYGYSDRVEITLPSGRPLVYMNARLEGSTKPGWEDSLAIVYDMAVKGKAERHETYGGKLVENITQALCRDFLACAMLRVEDEGYNIAMHVHDELVPEVEESRVDNALKVIEQIMEEPPEWAHDIPLVGKPNVARRYGK